jgi:dTDP-L-rhamnose 4-epimerase
LSEQYRLGDVRHASCDIQRTSELLGWRPKFAVRDGIKRLAVWIDEQLASNIAVRT